MGGEPVDREEYACPCGGPLWKWEKPDDKSELWACANCDGKFEVTTEEIRQQQSHEMYVALIKTKIKEQLGPAAFAQALADGTPVTCHCGVKVTPKEASANNGLCERCRNEMDDFSNEYDEPVESEDEVRKRLEEEEQQRAAQGELPDGDYDEAEGY